MESLIPSLVNRKWFLCSLASFFGLLFVCFSLNKASRPAPAFASFRDSQTSLVATLLESGEPLSSQSMHSGGPIRSTQTVDIVQPPTTNIALSPLSSYMDLLSPQISAKEPKSSGVPVVSSESNGTNPVSSQSKMEMPRYKENYTSLLVPVGGGAKKEKIKEEKKCDIFDGKWVYDRKGYPLYRGHWCPFLSDQVSCQKNGRPDKDYEHWRWQPKGCEIPRYNGKELLERWRGKRVVIVGDSLNRNMWESLACILYSSGRRSKAYVKSNSPEYKIFRALDFDCTVEFYWNPFLVELEERKDNSKILKLDKLPGSSKRWRGADVMVFNTGHWWTHHGKIRGWDHFEFRGQLMEEMGVIEAFNKALRTWARWVDRHVDSTKTTVFFRSVSPEHKRDNWCYNQTRPITTETYVQRFPRNMISSVERAIQKMTTPVRYLNITRLSEYRRDAHTTVYTSRQGILLTAEQRKQPEIYADCSHWCLPGLPDTWNALLFASLFGVPSTVS
uniref:Protein trichome birefringence-like 42 isoform X1 n=2 Tax=Elaeis guineensis var. tenera TaxID=51953 RepID=A0A6I9QTN8_ELAGV|nr:protein trichome birefringence-like 42 isoform X1 [Elaeis guineensis]